MKNLLMLICLVSGLNLSQANAASGACYATYNGGNVCTEYNTSPEILSQFKAQCEINSEWVNQCSGRVYCVISMQGIEMVQSSSNADLTDLKNGCKLGRGTVID